MANHHTIVILDSHPAAAFVTQRSLESEFGNAVTTHRAASPSDAWEQCVGSDVHLLIMDPTDYGEACWVLVRLLRESLPHLSMMVLAANCTPLVRLRASEVGVICMPKTNNIRDIYRTVRGLLDGSQPVTPAC